MKKDTIIFDMDGTILNTLDDLCDSVNYMLGQVGLPKRTLDEIRSFVGNGVALLIKRAIGDSGADFEKCFAIFSKHYDKNKDNKTRPYDGILELLGEIQGDYKTAVVSNKYDRAVKELNETMFGGMLNVAIGERDGVPAKPAPDGVYDALENLGSKKESAVYIGDSEVDLMTAQNSGLDFIAVSWGFREKSFLQSLGCEHIADSPNEIKEIIKNL